MDDEIKDRYDDDEDSMQLEEGLAPHNIVDKVAFGRRLRAQRVLMGFDRVSDLTQVLRSRYGVDVSDRTVYAIERGEQMPHLDFYLGACAALDVHPSYFMPAIRHDVGDMFSELRQR